MPCSCLTDSQMKKTCMILLFITHQSRVIIYCREIQVWHGVTNNGYFEMNHWFKFLKQLNSLQTTLSWETSMIGLMTHQEFCFILSLTESPQNVMTCSFIVRIFRNPGYAMHPYNCLIIVLVILQKQSTFHSGKILFVLKRLWDCPEMMLSKRNLNWQATDPENQE